jgi:hypothetical protein
MSAEARWEQRKDFYEEALSLQKSGKYSQSEYLRLRKAILWAMPPEERFAIEGFDHAAEYAGLIRVGVGNQQA